jgi:uncharacterized protein YecE (DUF72 family)
MRRIGATKDDPRAGEPEAPDEHRIVVGTSGYSFPDWVGPFYPPGIERTKMLDYYVKEFPAVEINATYYRIPPARSLHAMERKTPPDFEFVVKTHHDMTHERSLDPDLYRSFEGAIDPLRASGKLSGIMAQFPYAFRRTPENEAFLRALRDRLPSDVPLFVEFRHDSWTEDGGVFDFLEKEGLGYVSVDEPDLPGLVPPIARRTGPVGYVRFHGRNTKKWWGPESMLRGKPDRAGSDPPVVGPRKRAMSTPSSVAGLPLFSGSLAPGSTEAAAAKSERRTSSTRYDYLYSEDELNEWVEKISEMTEKAKKTFVFFNNCHVGQAATSAKLMRRLLEGGGLL